MNKRIFLSALAIFMMVGSGLGLAQMMGPGQHMYGGQGSAAEQQQIQQTIPYPGYPPMMGYGYGMSPGMMGYGMGPGMMGGYGYGMGPGMMGYGHGMQHGMMHGYGYPGMMGYGMGPGQWGGCGGWYPGTSGEYAEKFNKALDETQELRRKMHSLQFEYGEALRNPDISEEKKKEMAEELYELREEIHKKMHP